MIGSEFLTKHTKKWLRFARKCHALNLQVSELNSQPVISPSPNGAISVQQGTEILLRERLRHLIANSPPDAPFKENKKLNINLSGDGTKIGKRIHVETFYFTILWWWKTAVSFQGTHPLSIFKEQEKYEHLNDVLHDITDIKELTSIEVDGEAYKIEYFLGGDWKFLVIVTLILSKWY